MGETFIINLGRESLMVIIAISAPVLLSALFVGVFVSIMQAVTQIQDMTLTFVPKFFVMLLMLSILGGFILNTLERFTVYLISAISTFAH